MVCCNSSVKHDAFQAWPGLEQSIASIAGLGGTLGSIKLIFNDASTQTTPFSSAQDPDYGEIFQPVEYAFAVGETVTSIAVTCAPLVPLPKLCVRMLRGPAV